MHTLFVELPAFSRYRQNYLGDDEFRALQAELLANPETGDFIECTGGLRKMRQAEQRRGKGKRGGLRVIYYWWETGRQIWLFTLYNKNELTDLSPTERKVLKERLKQELEARR